MLTYVNYPLCMACRQPEFNCVCPAVGWVAHE